MLLSQLLASSCNRKLLILQIDFIVSEVFFTRRDKAVNCLKEIASCSTSVLPESFVLTKASPDIGDNDSFEIRLKAV